MSTDENDPLAEIVAHHAMADGHLRRTQSYVERGRKYQTSSIDQLKTIFVDTFAVWRQNPLVKPIANDDVIAEYELRRIEPPYDLISDDLNVITSEISASIASMPDEDRERMLDNFAAEIPRIFRRGN